MINDDPQALAVTDRLFDAALGAFDLIAIAVGDRLGYYRALAAEPGLPADAIAHRTDTHARYVREWLEQQAATGLLLRDGDDEWRLAPGVAPVLADPDDPRHLAPLARQIAAVAARVPRIAEGAEHRRGVSWAEFGDEMRESEADLNRPAFLGPLGTEWLPAIPAVHERLSRRGARVADVGCGEAWSAIGIARAYPTVAIDAFDLDPASVAAAERHVCEAGLLDRIRPRCADVAYLAPGAGYDVATAFECVHDMAFPVRALSALRGILAEDGVLLVADMRAEEEAVFPAGPVERLLYGFSVGVCLPDAMATPGSAMTGTVLRPAAFRAIAVEAGFTRVEEAPVDHDLWRFWLLTP